MYDFKSLSSYDFEMLTRDLLQKEMNITIENFKTGRDGGIDLRYAKSNQNQFIVQCKHYASSTYSNLISDLKNKEVPKIEKLKPKRYIVVTSQGLTPANKEEIKVLFTPYCLSSSDVYGSDDLNNLITKFPDIEKQHYKLWLTSIAVMDKILHSNVYNQSEIELQKIKDKSKFYVQNKSYFKAKEILKELNYCIIAGIPGIGKSTLAEILIIDYITQGFEVFKISNSISEVFEVYNSAQKQVFYYDDFLGQTTLEEKLNKNEDQQILQFIEAVKKNKKSKFILTTREYILNKAKTTYERLANSNFDFKKCIIDLHDYTKFDRAKILFNHIYFSRLPELCVRDLLQNKNYLKIINHPNYNPRIIEWMTKLYTNENIINYITEFMENLNNPSRLWQHIFENQLSDFSKNVLLALMTFSNAGILVDIQETFMNFSIEKSKIYSAPIPSGFDFNKALRELEGNFISTNKYNDTMLISFSNPSVRDFLESYICSNLYEFKLLINSSSFFDQVVTLYNLVPKAFNLSKKPILKFIDELILSIKKNFKSTSLNFTINKHGQTNYVSRERESLEKRLIFTIDLTEELKIKDAPILIDSLFTIILELIKSKETSKDNVMYMLRQLSKSKYKYLIDTIDCKSILKEYFLKDLNCIKDFEFIGELDEILKIITSIELTSVKEVFEYVHKEEIKQLITEEDTDYISDYICSLEAIESFFNIDVDLSIDELKDRIDELEYQNVEPPDYDDYTHDSAPYIRDTEDDLISNLFDSLEE